MIEPRRVATIALLLQPLLWFSPGRRYPWAIFGLEEAGAPFWAAVALAATALAIPVARRMDRNTELGGQTLERIGSALLLSCPILTLSYDFASALHFHAFGYSMPWPLIALEAAVLVALVLWIRAGRPLGRGILIATAAVAAHRTFAVALFPLVTERSDMLFVIRRSCEFLVSGASPFNDIGAPGAFPYMPYPPGTLFVHVPAMLAGIDPRWTGTVVLLVFGLTMAKVVRTPRTELLAVLVLLNPYHAFRHDLYFEAFSVLSAALFFHAARAGTLGRGGRATLTLMAGVAVATRQWAWGYAPFLLLAVATGAAPRPANAVALAGRATLASLLCAAGAASLLAPVIAINLDLFLARFFVLFDVTGGELCLGLAPLAKELGLLDFLRPVQAIIAFGMFGHAYAQASRSRAAPSEIIALGWVAWVLLVVANPFIENYFYLSPSFAAVGIAAAHERAPGARPGSAPSPRDRGHDPGG
ncbi:MAG: hypothetical protein HY722_06215 [Planctomycetes bacterium]|nr:hypothetical protein [Planctomycetota bacterium]